MAVMVNGDDGISGNGFGFRQVISHEPPWWVVTVYGPFLRPEGVRARSRTLAGVQDAASSLYPHDQMQLAAGTSGVGYHTDVSYDFGPGVNADRDAFIAACTARVAAESVYAKHGRAAAAELFGEMGATLADVAAVLFVSRFEAARLIAARPRQHKLFAARVGLLREHAVRAVARAAATATAMAWIIAADALRVARRRYARRAAS